jgi:DNA-binding response OmpR family regulator
MKKDILIVTDNFEYRAIMEKYLSGSFDVKITGSAEKTLSMLEEGFNPKLIITEFSVSLPNGKRLIIKIKENSKYVHIPILVISGDENKIMRLDLIRTGTTGHIMNPFILTDLESRIKSLLNIAV